MGGPFSVKAIHDYIDNLRDSIIEYYGAINEIKAQIRSADKMPVEPEAMYLYKRCKSMGIPLVAGGVMDQPHIWLIEWNVIENQITMMESLPSLNGDANGK